MTEEKGFKDFVDMWESLEINGHSKGKPTGHTLSIDICPVSIKEMMEGFGTSLDYIPELPPAKRRPDSDDMFNVVLGGSIVFSGDYYFCEQNILKNNYHLLGKEVFISKVNDKPTADIVKRY